MMAFSGVLRSCRSLASTPGWSSPFASPSSGSVAVTGSSNRFDEPMQGAGGLEHVQKVGEHIPKGEPLALFDDDFLVAEDDADGRDQVLGDHDQSCSLAKLLSGHSRFAPMMGSAPQRSSRSIFPRSRVSSMGLVS